MKTTGSVTFALPFYGRSSEAETYLSVGLRVTAFAIGVISVTLGVLILPQVLGLGHWDWTIGSGVISAGLLLIMGSSIKYLKKELQPTSQTSSPPSSVTSDVKGKQPASPSNSLKRQALSSLFSIELWSLASQNHPQNLPSLLPKLELPIEESNSNGTRVYFKRENLEAYSNKIQQQMSFLNDSRIDESKMFDNAITCLTDHLDTVNQTVQQKLSGKGDYFEFKRDNLPKVYSHDGNKLYQQLYLAMLSVEHWKGILPNIKQLISNILSKIRRKVDSTREDIENDVKLFRECLLARVPSFLATSGKDGVGVDYDILRKILDILYFGNDLKVKKGCLDVVDAGKFKATNEISLLSNSEHVCLGFGRNSEAHFTNYLFDGEIQAYLHFNNLCEGFKVPERLPPAGVAIAMKKEIFEALVKDKLPRVEHWQTPKWGDNNCFLSSAFMLAALFDEYYQILKQ